MTLSNKWLIILILLFCQGISSFAQKVKIGTYDSRIVALAYSRSDGFPVYMQKIQKSYDEAEKAKDTAKMEEALFKIMTYQHLLHQMVFSSGSANLFVSTLKDKLPELAKKEGLAAIVSKFEVQYSDPAAVLVDVTDQMVALCSPKGDLGKMLEEMKKAEPMPIEEITFDEEVQIYVKKFANRFHLNSK